MKARSRDDASIPSKLSWSTFNSDFPSAPLREVGQDSARSQRISALQKIGVHGVRNGSSSSGVTKRTNDNTSFALKLIIFVLLTMSMAIFILFEFDLLGSSSSGWALSSSLHSLSSHRSRHSSIPRQSSSPSSSMMTSRCLSGFVSVEGGCFKIIHDEVKSRRDAEEWCSAASAVDSPVALARHDSVTSAVVTTSAALTAGQYLWINASSFPPPSLGEAQTVYSSQTLAPCVAWNGALNWCQRDQLLGFICRQQTVKNQRRGGKKRSKTADSFLPDGTFTSTTPTDRHTDSVTQSSSEVQYEAEWTVGSVVSNHSFLRFSLEDLPLCTNLQVNSVARSLGDRILGTIRSSVPYTLTVGLDLPRTIMCSKLLDRKDISALKRLILQGYRMQWYVDGVPAMTRAVHRGADADAVGVSMSEGEGEGVSIGTMANLPPRSRPQHVLFNHYRIDISYTQSYPSPAPLAVPLLSGNTQPLTLPAHHLPQSPRVVRVDVSPLSINRLDGGAVRVEDLWKQPVEISFEVRWVKVPFTSTSSAATASSSFFVLFPPAMAALLLSLAVMLAILSCLQPHRREEVSESTWLPAINSVCETSEVILPSVVQTVESSPDGVEVLAALTGAGVHLVCVIAVVCAFVWFHGASDIDFGEAASVMIFIFCLSASIAGYCSSRVHILLSRHNANQRCTVLTRGLCAYPVTVLSWLTVTNTVSSMYHSTLILPVSSWLAILLLWVLVYCPLWVMGAYAGYVEEDEDNMSRSALRVKTMVSSSSMCGAESTCSCLGRFFLFSLVVVGSVIAIQLDSDLEIDVNGLSTTVLFEILVCSLMSLCLFSLQSSWWTVYGASAAHVLCVSAVMCFFHWQSIQPVSHAGSILFTAHATMTVISVILLSSGSSVVCCILYGGVEVVQKLF